MFHLAWSEQEFSQPQIISSDRAPLTTLISERHLTKYGIDANKINAWFVPLMADFCEKMNALIAVESQKITCTHKSGCGIDDDCSMDEICNDRVGGGYVCRKEACPALLSCSNSQSSLL